jgi:signal peptidase I
MVDAILDDPATWRSDAAQRLFDRQERSDADVRKFGPDQFFPMGDNSPSSLDARYWKEPAYVERSQLLGRALFVFFPHTWNRPVPFFPDFTRMKFIR